MRISLNILWGAVKLMFIKQGYALRCYDVTVLQFTVLQFTVLQFTVLQLTVLQFTVLERFSVLAELP